MAQVPAVVIGHKNPDTDSVCSAMAYAEYKREVDGVDARAYRAGNMNAQTRFVLERFGREPPPVLADVYPRIRDIMIPREALYLMQPEEPIARARRVILENRFTFLPVALEDDTCRGKITALRLAALLDELDPSRLNQPVTLELASLLDAADGAEIVPRDGKKPPERVSGMLRIAGPDDTGSTTQATPSIIVGTTSDIRTLSPAGVTLAVIAGCADEKRRKEARDWARSHGLTAVVAAQGMPGVCAAIRLAMPLDSCLEDAGPTFSPDDLLRDVNREVNRYNEGGFIIVDEENRIVGVVTRVNFMTDARFRVILVDHNEFSQSVDGMDGAAVTEIIDHHRIGGRSTSEPITFVNRAVGSTCTIVTDLYRQTDSKLSTSTAGLLLSGILSDTVVLRSPTTTATDRAAAQWLAGIVEVDVEAYGEEMFEAGSEIQELSAREILERDMKYYEEGSFQFSVSQVEMVGFKAFWDRAESLQAEVDAHCARAGLSFACLMVTDITHGVTLLVVGGDSRIANEITHPRAAPGVYEMKDVLSRKKQVLPYLAELLQEL